MCQPDQQWLQPQAAPHVTWGASAPPMHSVVHALLPQVTVEPAQLWSPEQPM